jgi:hypothetical protein
MPRRRSEWIYNFYIPGLTVLATPLHISPFMIFDAGNGAKVVNLREF